jgi:hypothetical protein
MRESRGERGCDRSAKYAWTLVVILVCCGYARDGRQNMRGRHA